MGLLGLGTIVLPVEGDGLDTFTVPLGLFVLTVFVGVVVDVSITSSVLSPAQSNNPKTIKTIAATTYIWFVFI